VSLLITQPGGGPDVTRRNKLNTLYITGDANTDGSIRIVFTAADNIDQFANIEQRDKGVFNDTGFRFASSSISIGRDMLLSAVAGFLESVNPSAIPGHTKSLIPHIIFNELGTGEPHTPIAGPIQTVPLIFNPVGEVTGTTLSQVYTLIPSSILDSFTLLVGTLAPTADVRVSIYIGSDASGFLANRLIKPASDFVANTPVVIDYKEDFGFEAAQAIFLELVSANSFSLQVDGKPQPELITTLIGHELRELELKYKPGKELFR